MLTRAPTLLLLLPSDLSPSASLRARAAPCGRGVAEVDVTADDARVAAPLSAPPPNTPELEALRSPIPAAVWDCFFCGCCLVCPTVVAAVGAAVRGVTGLVSLVSDDCSSSSLSPASAQLKVNLFGAGVAAAAEGWSEVEDGISDRLAPFANEEERN